MSCDLPPRRELPFDRLDTPDSSSTRPGSRPLSGIMGPPTVPASALSSTKRPNSRAGSSHSAELPPLRKPTYISKSLTGQTDKLATGLGSISGTKDNMRPHSAIVQKDYTTMQQVLSSAPALSPTVPRPASSYNPAAPHPLSIGTDRESYAQASAPLATPPGSDINMLSSSPEDKSKHKEELAAYARQSDNVRLNELNDFIFQHLQDENFLTLVDDMAMAWARIGTGLE